mgnify:CR=1 FL=1
MTKKGAATNSRAFVQAENVVRRIEAYATKNFLQIVSKEKVSLIEQLVKKHKPKTALELGTLIGYSAIIIGRNLPETARLYTVEINKERAAAAKTNMAEAGLSEKIEVVVADGHKFCATIKTKFDFVFFDVCDYLKCLRALESNGCINKRAVVAANNVKWFDEALKRYLDYVRNSGNYISKFYDFGYDGVEVSIRQ